MARQPDFAYVQARIQARHGERLDEAGWRALRSHRSLGLYLDHAAATSLARFTAGLAAELGPHELERRLRALWRAYLVEAGGWAEPRWRPALQWLARLPELTLIEHLRHGGEAPGWLADDPALAPFTAADAEQRRAALRQAGFAPVEPDAGPDATSRALWLARFATLWPAGEPTGLAALRRPLAVVLTVLAGDHAGQPLDHRLALCERALTSLMRRQASQAPALFAHLGLVLVDLMRLRGDLLGRLLFNAAAEGRA
jgi:hypothetical protein